MTNLNIIANACASVGYTKEQIESYFNKNGYLPLNTYSRWAKLGYQVKKNEHARAITRIWKLKRNATLTQEEQEQAQEEQSEEQLLINFYKVNCFLFDISQVEKAEIDA